MTASRVVSRIDITLQMSGSFLSVKTSQYIFPEAPSIFWAIILRAEGIKDNKLDMNDFFSQTGEFQDY